MAANKYLSDGRKVLVINKLNNDQTIVQEIFINKDEEEIPSGEHFVVSSLHDEPVTSYVERERDRAKKELSVLKNDKIYIQNKNKGAMAELKGLRAIIKSTENLICLLGEKDLELFSQFVTGTIEYLVVEHYSEITAPIKMIDRIIAYEHSYNGELTEFDSLKLISILGKSNGEFEYRIHSYSDGSGGSTKVYPFTNETDAIEHIKRGAVKQIKENKLSEQSFRVCMNLGIKFEDELQQQYDLVIEKRKNQSILRLEKNIVDCQAELSAFLKTDDLKQN